MLERMENDTLSLLRDALAARDFALAEQLVLAGASLDDLIEEDGDSFLHRAAQDGDLEMAGFYLKHGCAKTLETFDCISQTPLIHAAANGHIVMVARLLAAGARPNAHDEERIGNTAIREAVRHGHAKIAELLLRAGADPTIPGWMGISAVDQAHYQIDGGLDSDEATEIQQMLAKYPSSVRDRRRK